METNFENRLPPSIFINQIVKYMEKGFPFNLNQTVIGKIDYWGTPYLKIRLKDSEEWITAAIDTGAYRTATTPDLVIDNKLHPIDTDVQNFTAAGMHEVGVYRLEFEIMGIKNHIFSEQVIGAPFEHTHTLLIGNNFISRCKEFRILVSEGYFELKM